MDRDKLAIERADCVDCGATWRGPRSRYRAGQHAGRRGHRVAWVRTAAAEIRPKRWPAGRT